MVDRQEVETLAAQLLPSVMQVKRKGFLEPDEEYNKKCWYFALDIAQMADARLGNTWDKPIGIKTRAVLPGVIVKCGNKEDRVQEYVYAAQDLAQSMT